ncbi:hypothetical protein N7456_010803 [Penicillium angulare]|uniref:Uncharacterized protein n=1 Tax=Penicillium angulare TaxID=116970 RepID=A0A9W9ESI3_9EURO|nr:hypothetical protein N7456_010803 [Penicillium angulare]
MPASWFQYPLVTVGNVIQLEKKQWTVLRQYGERDAQASSDDPPSFVSTKLKCQSGNITAYMRIFMQVPFIGTESTPPHERAKQATTFNPRELQALSRLTTKGSRFAPRLLDTSIQTQDSVNGLVPGGALVFLVWEIVPGVRLGDTLGSDVFWALSPDERNRIRAALVRGYE